MGGGGVMQHAVDTNKAHKAQKQHRRSRFNGNHSSETLLNSNQRTRLDFSHLSEEEILVYRRKLALKLKRRKILEIVMYVGLTAITVGFLLYLLGK